VCDSDLVRGCGDVKCTVVFVCDSDLESEVWRCKMYSCVCV
jgi:hypothetical protein